MPETEHTEEKTTEFLAALTELSRTYGLGIAVGVAGQPATLFILERDDCDDFNRRYKIDTEGRLLFD
jgi:hypothetical protein